MFQIARRERRLAILDQAFQAEPSSFEFVMPNADARLSKTGTWSLEMNTLLIRSFRAMFLDNRRSCNANHFPKTAPP